MPIKKNDLEKMNDLIDKGSTIAEVARKFTNYDYCAWGAWGRAAWGAWGRAAVTGQYDSDWFQKRAQFWGYNDVFGGKKKVIGITCGQSQGQRRTSVRK